VVKADNGESIVALPLAVRGRFKGLPRKEAKSAYNREHYHKNPDRQWATNLRNKYGLTVGQYAAMFEAQEGRCAVCGATASAAHQKRLSVDHDPITGQVRGLLCGACNKAIGLLAHNRDLLSAADRYLNLHQSRG
jgi:hypothetical protein